MAAHQGTGLPALSLPNGASSLPLPVLPSLEQFDKIYLWMDNDLAGQRGARKFADKLGLKRCSIVNGPHCAGRHEHLKDANDCLREGVDMKALLHNSAPFPHEQILTFEQLANEVKMEIESAAAVDGIPSQDFPSLHKYLKGLRPGELTIVTGPTGIGKTSWLSQYSLDFCRQGVPTLWGSFELSNVRLAKKMLMQHAGINLTKKTSELAGAVERFSQLPLFFLRFYGSTEVDRVLDAMEYAHYVYDVEHIVLDNLQFMTSGFGSGWDKFEVQDAAISKFRSFASSKNVHITLVIHPRKVEEDKLLDVASVFGTAKATQECDTLIILQAARGNKHLDIKKNRYSGDLGKVNLIFDPESGRYSEFQSESKEQVAEIQRKRVFNKKDPQEDVKVPDNAAVGSSAHKQEAGKKKIEKK